MNQIQEIEISLEDARKAVRLRDKLVQLSDRADFKEIFREGYLQNEAARLVALSADPSARNMKDDIFEAITAISHFKQYMNNIIIIGNNAEQAIYDGEEMLDDLRAEQTEDQ